jgi:hypothetical protein
MIIQLLLATIISTSAFAETWCKEGTKFHTEKDLKKLKAEVFLATTAGNAAKIRSLAKCDLHIGEQKADVTGYRNASAVADEIAKLTKGVKWSAKSTDGSNDLIDSVKSEKPAGDFQLVLSREDSQSEWYWEGFLAKDAKTAQKLLKNSYNYPPSDEPKGESDD